METNWKAPVAGSARVTIGSAAWLGPHLPSNPRCAVGETQAARSRRRAQGGALKAVRSRWRAERQSEWGSPRGGSPSVDSEGSRMAPGGKHQVVSIRWQ